MQTLQVANEDDMSVNAVVVDTVLKAMFLFRSEWRRQKPADITVTQFRALAFIFMNPGVSLSELKDALDLTASSASRILDVLVRRNLVLHQVCDDDRRRARLDVTEDGGAVLRDANTRVTNFIGRALINRTAEEKSQIHHAMILLKDSLMSVKTNSILTGDTDGGTDNGK